MYLIKKQFNQLSEFHDIFYFSSIFKRFNNVHLMFFVLFSLFAELEVIRITYFSWEPNDNPEQTMFKQFTNKDGHWALIFWFCFTFRSLLTESEIFQIYFKISFISLLSLHCAIFLSKRFNHIFNKTSINLKSKKKIEFFSKSEIYDTHLYWYNFPCNSMFPTIQGGKLNSHLYPLNLNLINNLEDIVVFLAGEVLTS